MDTIRFDVAPAPEPDDRDNYSDSFSVVRIIVNGRDLRELVREVELPCAKAEGSPEIAGNYVGLEAEVLSSRHFRGEAERLYKGRVLERGSSPNRVAIYICECGEPGCWPLIVSIEVEDDRVIWRNFRQPHRNNWDYDALGPFTFSRREYEAALHQAATSLNPSK